MVDVLKSGERNVDERAVAKALNRRALLTKSVLVAGAWSAGAGFDAAKAAQSMERAFDGNTNVVLAHGAWADGSSWSKVIVGVKAKGVKAWSTSRRWRQMKARRLRTSFTAPNQIPRRRNSRRMTTDLSGFPKKHLRA